MKMEAEEEDDEETRRKKRVKRGLLFSAIFFLGAILFVDFALFFSSYNVVVVLLYVHFRIVY